MPYAVKEIYYTLQGEGFHTGRPAVFLRFSGCNLWSGREEDRVDAVCRFCDTDFWGTDGPGGGRFFSAAQLAESVAAHWPAHEPRNGPGNEPGNVRRSPSVSSDTSNRDRFVVCTGGEPLLQLDAALIEALHDHGFEIAVETNGTIELPAGLDWVCVSPKAEASLTVTQGDELKLVFPQNGIEPNQFEALAFSHFYLQPMDGEAIENNTRAATEYCLHYPRWKLSLQTHKLLGIP